VAATALGNVLKTRPNYPEVVKALSLAVGDTSDAVRLAAATALSAEGVDRLAALSEIHAALHDSAHADVRAFTARIIGSWGPKRSTPLIPALLEATKDSVAIVRAAAVEALGMIQATAPQEVDAIVKLAADPDPAVRQAVLQTLPNLRAPAAVTFPLAAKGLSDSSAPVRAAAAFALADLRSGAIPALAALTKALSDSSSLVRTGAAFALGAMGRAAESAAPALRRLTKDESPQVARIATESLDIVLGTAKPRSSEPTEIEKCANAIPGTRCK
jgi:HEAT repeat protein